jgi:membrane protease YdiL (CAAX protease family)
MPQREAAGPTRPGEKRSVVAIAFLLLLRLCLAVPWLHASELYRGAVFPTLTYLVTLYVLLLNRGDLAKYRIDRLSYLLILVAGPFQFLYCGTVEHRIPAYLGAAVSTAAAVAFAAIAFRNGLVPSGRIRDRLPSFLAGLVGGLVVAVVVNAASILRVRPADSDTGLVLQLLSIAALIPLHLFTAAVWEEPLFRGFLLTKLKEWRLNTLVAVLVQAAVFTVAHLYYFPRAEFYLLVPVCGIAFGALAVTTKSLSSSMAAHATVNALVYTLVPLIASVAYMS